MWYKFTATQNVHTITLGGLGAGFTSPEIQLYSDAPGSLTSLQCTVATSLTNSSLTIGTTYYVRVSNVSASAPSATATFTICVTYPPPNDDCTNATYLYSNTSCSNTASTLAGATPSVGIPLGCGSAGTDYDVWFTFVAASTQETVTLSGMTGIATPAVQLYSGACGGLISVACGTTSLTATGLSVGSTYYVRVSNVGGGATGSGNFNICVTHPAPSIPNIDYSRSYINVTTGATGGTVNPGDTLEMRATLVIRSGTVDSLSFIDTLFNTKGLRLVPGSIALRTNEGKIYGSAFSDAFDSDAGWHYQNGLDTIIKINFGAGASNYKEDNEAALPDPLFLEAPASSWPPTG